MALLVSEGYFYLAICQLNYVMFTAEFESGAIAGSLVNRLVEVGDCQLHCSLPWESLTSQPAPHQILLESRSVLVISPTSQLTITPGICPMSGRGT